VSKGQKFPPHKVRPVFRIAESYDHDTLGAPFKVTLKNSVEVSIDPTTGEELVRIPDPMGLIRAVVRCRVRDPRKLSGKELRFVRRAFDLPANKLAAFLHCSAEHYSRCESGGKALSPTAEQVLRLFAYVATLCSEPHKLLEPGRNVQPKFLDQKSEQEALGFINVFTTMKIETVRSADEMIEYVFSRCPPAKRRSRSADDDADWKRLQPVASAA
jgi:DNA-binding transcriptional regulator YiaG